MTAELVPLTYARRAYNILHGTELQAHGDILTAEQAERINRYYDIELHLGTHATGVPRSLGGLYWDAFRPSASEYDQAAAIVEALRLGDTLFLESHGFTYQPESSSQIDERLSTQQELEQRRREGSISAWRYAEGLAALKGIPIVYADHDAFEKDSLRDLTNGKGMRELGRSSNEEERLLYERMNHQRELKACNTVKDWALNHLPLDDTAAYGSGKPKLVVVFGRAHKQGLEEAFSNLGLDAKTILMRSSGEEREVKTQELAARLVRGLVGAPPRFESLMNTGEPFNNRTFQSEGPNPNPEFNDKSTLLEPLHSSSEDKIFNTIRSDTQKLYISNSYEDLGRGTEMSWRHYPLL